ncbi:hypothetical protein ACERK3_16425 [Phycisphaerales bacterium AB-hyl4]|uniref:DUF1559 domain-containing protein n=1 Tax=Natronomicrosphaera hydrolytica TaxID=3242702 RepID=A0ABV4U8D4_9BACT
MSEKRDQQARRREQLEQPVQIRYVSPADAPVLDAIVDGSAVKATMSETDAQRREKVESLLGLLDAVGPDESGDEQEAGVRRAIAAVQAARQRERFATQVQMLTEPEPTLGVGWRQVAMAAAAFVVAVSLLFPVLEHNRSEARRIACASNLQQAGMAFGQYAAANNGMMPRGHVQPGSTWWNVGQQPDHEHGASPSNTAHLFILIRQRYVEPETLACPENSAAFVQQLTQNQIDWPSPDAVSYSYQNQYTSDPLRLSRSGHAAVLADKNPLFVMGASGMSFDEKTPRTAASRIHDGRGQSLLTADGGVRWTVSPMLRIPGRGDSTNFWVADGVKTFTGRELPSSPDDSFLVP